MERASWRVWNLCVPPFSSGWLRVNTAPRRVAVGKVTLGMV